jgi:hypothetical protein
MMHLELVDFGLLTLCYSAKSPFAQVFSAFGFVHKIATFEKQAGFQVSCASMLCNASWSSIGQLIMTDTATTCD